MAYEPRRTLLVGLSALAVVLTAALFPAAGVGTHPAGSAGVGVPAGSTSVDTPEPTPTPDVDPTPTEPRDEPDEDTPEQDTPEPETTAPPVDDGDGGGLLSGLTLMALLGAVLRLFAVALVGCAVAGLGLVVHGAEPGTPHVELPFGYSITLPFVVPEWVGAFGTRISRLTMGFVVSVSASVTQLLDASAAALRAVTGGLGIVASEGLRGVAKLLAGLPAALASALSGLTALPAALLSLPAALSTVGGSISGSTERPGEDARAMAPDPVEPEPADEDPDAPDVKDAWVRMVELLPVERAPSTTPSEFARAAAERGFPAAPIRRVTRAFEDVVYGGYEAGPRAKAAREALGSLRDRLGGGDA